MSRIFISYRRADSAAWAAQLNRHIGLRFGKDLVFQDVEDIKPGEDFLAALRRELASCQAFLIVIGPQWLVDAQGRRRLDDPDDVLRAEVLAALSGTGAVIPVLVGGAAMPSARELPPALGALAKRQAKTLTDAQWARDVQALLERLREIVLPAAGDTTLAQAQREVWRLQQDYFERLDAQRAADALELAQKAQGVLDHVLPLFPDDPYLKLTRGYLHKNEAMALKPLSRHDEAAAALDRAEAIFRVMLQERPADAGAINGLGSVEAVRGHLEKAHAYVDEALRIDPGYEAALADHRELLKALGLASCAVIPGPPAAGRARPSHRRTRNG